MNKVVETEDVNFFEEKRSAVKTKVKYIEAKTDDEKILTQDLEQTGDNQTSIVEIGENNKESSQAEDIRSG